MSFRTRAPPKAHELRRGADEVAAGRRVGGGEGLDHGSLAVLAGDDEQAREADLDRDRGAVVSSRGVRGRRAEPEHLDGPLERRPRRDPDCRAVLEQRRVERREGVDAGVGAAGGATVHARPQVLGEEGAGFELANTWLDEAAGA